MQIDRDPAGEYWYRLKHVIALLGTPQLANGLTDGDVDQDCELGYSFEDTELADDMDVENALVTKYGLRQLAIHNGLSADEQVRLLDLLDGADFWGDPIPT